MGPSGKTGKSSDNHQNRHAFRRQTPDRPGEKGKKKDQTLAKYCRHTDTFLIRA